jgi:hypothetical protein
MILYLRDWIIKEFDDIIIFLENEAKGRLLHYGRRREKGNKEISNTGIC